MTTVTNIRKGIDFLQKVDLKWCHLDLIIKEHLVFLFTGTVKRKYILITRSVFYFSSLPFKWWLHALFRNAKSDIQVFPSFTSCNGINVLGTEACTFTGTAQEMSVWYSQVKLCTANINPLNAELSPTCHLLALLRAHHILHVSRIRVKGIYLQFGVFVI
jgi:hypothetical protein